MEARAILRYSRISPRKVRQVVDLVRGKDVEEAFHILQFTPKKAARIVERTLQSAVANAINREEETAVEEALLCERSICRWWYRVKAVASSAARCCWHDSQAI